MTDNEKIRVVRWQGWYRGWSDDDVLKSFADHISNYSTDAEAVQLLNVLVEKGYEVTLIYTHNGATVDISERIGYVLVECDAPTIHETITAAVLQVIEKEVNQCGNQ